MSGGVALVLRFVTGLAVGAACAVLAVGCASNTGASAISTSRVLAAGTGASAWANEAELAWLRKLGTWNAELMRGLQKAAEIETSPKLIQKLLAHDGVATTAHDRALAPANACESDLNARVGDPPTKRLRPSLEAFRRACGHLQRFYNAVTLAVARNDEGLVDDAQLEARAGGQLLLAADRLLPPGEVRELPVIGGDASRSRIEPRLGEAASALAGKRVEVRCWSHADWKRLLREEKAYTKHRIDEDTLGFAGIEGARVNLAPDICEGLVDLVYHHARPASVDAQAPLAAALVTLAHEPQHAKGIADEAQAECYAIQTADATAARLGVNAVYARRLVELYWAHYDEELAAYRSRQCRNGGAYDLNKATSAWP